MFGLRRGSWLAALGSQLVARGSQLLSVPLLCYIWHPHGTKPASGPGTGLRAIDALLSAVRPRNKRPADLWRLCSGHLPGLRLAAGISRRTRNRIIMKSPSVAQESDLAATESKNTLGRGLSLLDSVLLLAGGIIGSSIFLTAKDIAAPLPHPILFMLVWVMGALISMCAAFAFAELGSMFPDSGGQYVYLREAFGYLVAFLYGWMLFAVTNGGTIAALSVASAVYLSAIFPAISQEHVVFTAVGITLTRTHVAGLISIVFVTWMNVIGLRKGTVLQNVATWAKFIAMGAFVILGLA